MVCCMQMNRPAHCHLALFQNKQQLDQLSCCDLSGFSLLVRSQASRSGKGTRQCHPMAGLG